MLKLKSFVRWMTHEDRPYELHDDFLATLTRDNYLKFRHMDSQSFSASSPSHHEPYKLKTSFPGESKHQTPSKPTPAPQQVHQHSQDEPTEDPTPETSTQTLVNKCLAESGIDPTDIQNVMPVSVLETSSAPTTLGERDKLDLSSLVPPKGEMESSFNWTCPFKCPTSSTLCFGEPTLGKLNQETDFYMTKHMPKPSSGANRVSVSHSSLVTKNGEHFYGETYIHDFPMSWKHIKEVDWGDKLKLNYTTYGYMLMEIDWGDKFNYTSCGYPMANWQGHETHPTGHKTSEVDWGGHDPNPNHVNESLLSKVDWGAHNPDADDPEQLTGESIQSFLTFVVQLRRLVALGRLVTHAQVTTLSKLMVASS